MQPKEAIFSEMAEKKPISHFVKIDTLINNAGISCEPFSRIWIWNVFQSSDGYQFLPERYMLPSIALPEILKTKGLDYRIFPYPTATEHASTNSFDFRQVSRPMNDLWRHYGRSNEFGGFNGLVR